MPTRTARRSRSPVWRLRTTRPCGCTWSAPPATSGTGWPCPPRPPSPPHPSEPSAPLGVATGHDHDDGGFLVASGPYMVEGSAPLDFSLPPDQQRPESGLIPGKAITMVRNPAWDRDPDGLRGAYVDRIDVSIGGTSEQAAAAIDADRSDIVRAAGNVLTTSISDSPSEGPAVLIYRSSRATNSVLCDALLRTG
jgi:hypothetical protein